MGTYKDSKWFPHDADAEEDPKIMLLITQHGWEGFGLYWMLIQRLCKQPGYMLPFGLIDSISRISQVSKEKLHSIITKFNLFDTEGDYFYSPSLRRRMEPFEKRNNTNKQNALKGWESRRLKEPQKNAIALQPLCDGGEDNITQDNIRKHNIRKEKKTESKDSGLTSSLVDSNFLKPENIELEKLYDQAIEFFPEDLRPKTEKQRSDWIDTLEKLIRIDEKTPEKILQVIEHTRKDDFWQANFLSILKLRKKNKEGISYLKVFEHKMKADTSVSGSGRKIKNVNQLWETRRSGTSIMKPEDPLARFNKNTRKLMAYLKDGKLTSTKEPVFPEGYVPTKPELELTWLSCIEDLTGSGYLIKEVQDVIIYARENSFWKRYFTDLLMLTRKAKNGKSYFEIITNQIYNVKHNIPITQLELDSIEKDLIITN